jgi:hypothetical protein
MQKSGDPVAGTTASHRDVCQRISRHEIFRDRCDGRTHRFGSNHLHQFRQRGTPFFGAADV